MKRGLLCVSIILLLAACQTAPPAPAPTAIAEVATPLPTMTQSASSTPTAAPSASPSPSPSPSTTPPPTASPMPTTTSTPAAPSTPTATPASITRDVYVNSDSGLNLRAGPNATAMLLRTLPPGTHLTALGSPNEAGGVTWQKVQTDDVQTGWVAAQFLIDQEQASATPMATSAPLPIGETTPVVAPIAAAGYVYVIAPDGLNLRAQASASSQLLRTLADGQRLQTNGLGPGENGITWLNVKTEDNLEGWVAVQFVTTIVPSIAPSVPAINAADAVQEILRRTNALRQSSGVPGVTLNDDLSQLALEHSQYMAQNGITHSGAGGLSARQRIANAGYGAGRGCRKHLWRTSDDR